VSRKIPDDAFDHYVALGKTRSYKAVAERYGVTKRAVTKCAEREKWAERLEKIEQESRERGDKKLIDQLDEIRERHLVTIRAMMGRALSALKQYPLTSGMDAMRAAEMAIKLERLVVGEPTEHTATSVEELIRSEYRELMVDDDFDGEDDDDEESVEEGPIP
jgi:hypothetical protein